MSVFGLGLLLVIIGLSGVANLEQTKHIYQQILSFEENYRNTENTLEAVRLETFRMAILRRDRLLDVMTVESDYARQFEVHRSRIHQFMQQLRNIWTPRDSRALERLDAALNTYFTIVSTEFGKPRSAGNPEVEFRNTDIQSHRIKIFEITDEISQLNAENFQSRRNAMDRAVDDLQTDLWANMITALFVGLCIAAGAVVRISHLEQQGAQQQAATARAENQLRQLSQQLVSSQEQERKAISRELHDEIGQSLTALRIELGNLERTRSAPGDDFQTHLEETKKLAEQTLRSARSISMGLRPSMLDELGLGPALQWQAREFSRRFNIPVELQLNSDLRDLPDQHRTYLYRIVQEGLTNCARHSQARSIRVTVEDSSHAISVSVEDDGVGFQTGRTGFGLGLLGISERARELSGQVKVDSAPGQGTRVRVTLPRIAMPLDKVHQPA